MDKKHTPLCLLLREFIVDEDIPINTECHVGKLNLFRNAYLDNPFITCCAMYTEPKELIINTFQARIYAYKKSGYNRKELMKIAKNYDDFVNALLNVMNCV